MKETYLEYQFDYKLQRLEPLTTYWDRIVYPDMFTYLRRKSNTYVTTAKERDIFPINTLTTGYDFFEVMHTTGYGQFLIMRLLSLDEIVENIEKNIFLNYKPGDTYIERLNYIIISEFGFNRRNPNMRINSISNFIKYQRR